MRRVPLTQADGRVLARDFLAPIPLPPFTNSAVDGYAVRHADLSADGDTQTAAVGPRRGGRERGPACSRARRRASSPAR